jgi:hypothetical protein
MLLIIGAEEGVDSLYDIRQPHHSSGHNFVIPLMSVIFRTNSHDSEVLIDNRMDRIQVFLNVTPCHWDEWFPTFRKIAVPSFSRTRSPLLPGHLKLEDETTTSLETSAAIPETTLRRTAEYLNSH